MKVETWKNAGRMNVAETQKDLVGDDADLVDGEVLRWNEGWVKNVLSVDCHFEIEGVERRYHVEHDGAVFLGKSGGSRIRGFLCHTRKDSNRNR